MTVLEMSGMVFGDNFRKMSDKFGYYFGHLGYNFGDFGMIPEKILEMTG